MPKTLITKLISCFVLLLICKTALAQLNNDTSIYNQGLINLVNQFNNNIGQAAKIYNGFVYTNYDSGIQGNPYLDELNSWQTGSVDYDGQVFEGVSMQYDIYADQVIVSLANNLGPMRLISDKVTGFDLHHHHFVRIASSDLGVKSGFFDQLYGGRSQVVNKIAKALIASSGQSRTERYFQPVQDYHQYFIMKDKHYHHVDELGSVLNLFKDKKKELKKYIKDNNIQFNGLREYGLAAIAAEYDRLTK